MTKRETRLLALVLVLTTLALHLLHYLIFRDFHQLLFYFGLDVAFLPVSVLVLTLFVDRLLSEREKAQQRHKMNMVVGVFFMELGRPLLEFLTNLLSDGQEFLNQIKITDETTEQQLKQAETLLANQCLDLSLDPEDLQALKTLLHEHQELTLRLLANPVLLEHEDFTNVLWAVVHLDEELAARPELNTLPQTDVAHLKADTQRVYQRLLQAWLRYLGHLRRYYPYLFSFAVRTDPLQPRKPVMLLK